MGIDHFSKSVIDGANSNAFEGNSSSNHPTPPAEKFRALSSLYSQPDGAAYGVQPIVGESDFEPFHPNNFLLGGGYENTENNNQLTVVRSDVSMEKHDDESEDLVSSESSEYIYSPFDGMDTQAYNVNRVIDQPWPGFGGLSATFGFLNPRYQYPTEQFMERCYLCRSLLFKEHNDIYIFKGEYAFCSKQCRQVELDFDEIKEKAEAKAQKKSDAKRLKNIGKFPVVFELGPSAS